MAEESIQKKAIVYDASGDQHYDTISAFIKSIRGSDPDAALYWLAKMLHAGEDPRFIARRLDGLAQELGRGWTAELIEGDGFAFSRTLRGVTERHMVDGALMRSAEARRLDEMAGELQALFARPAIFRVKDEETRITGPIRLIDAVLQLGRKGISIQRYKGLGEMNPDQLWETTMNPETRRMLQVTIDDAIGADQLFNTLMGDQVDPRREFIEDNALTAENLDI